MLLCMTKSDFWGKFFFPKNGPKIGFFESIGKCSHYFFLNLVYKESLYQLLYSCTNPTLEENLVPEIGPKCSWPIRLLDF